MEEKYWVMNAGMREGEVKCKGMLKRKWGGLEC